MNDTGLKHECLDNAVKDDSVVVVVFGMRAKVLDGPWTLIGI